MFDNDRLTTDIYGWHNNKNAQTRKDTKTFCKEQTKLSLMNNFDNEPRLQTSLSLALPVTSKLENLINYSTANKLFTFYLL